jgi:hypothetical protein
MSAPNYGGGAAPVTFYPEDPKTTEQIAKAFTYHSPKDDQPLRYQSLRVDAKVLAENIVSACPPSRERSLAMTKLEEAVMWANASIARNE